MLPLWMQRCCFTFLYTKNDPACWLLDVPCSPCFVPFRSGRTHHHHFVKVTLMTIIAMIGAIINTDKMVMSCRYPVTIGATASTARPNISRIVGAGVSACMPSRFPWGCLSFWFTTKPVSLSMHISLHERHRALSSPVALRVHAENSLTNSVQVDDKISHVFGELPISLILPWSAHKVISGSHLLP